MIEALILRNFQTHEKLSVKMDKITTFVGKTDSGKSSIIRGLVLLGLNDLRGTAFIRHGTKQASVAARVDGKTVKRVRGKVNNVYLLNGEEYRAFGSTVPEDVASHLSLSPINFQLQHEMPFWLSLSDPEVSRRLNQIIDFSLIDEAASKIASLIRENKNEVTYKEELVEELKEELKTTKAIKTADKEFQEVEKLVALAERRTKKTDRLLTLISTAERAKKKIREVPSIVVTEQLIMTYKRDLDREQALKHQIQVTEDRLKEWEDALHRFKLAEEDFHQKTEGEACPLCGNKLK